MSDRAHILEALRELDDLGCELPDIPHNRELFRVPKGALADMFQERLECLSGEVIRVSNAVEARNALLELTDCAKATFDGSDALEGIIPASITTVTDEDNDVLATVDVGITGADALVARTGSVILSSDRGGRRLSSLPPTHIVIAWTSQIVATLSDVSFNPESGSCLTIVSGPSRTADIEKILVLGAHGPKRFVVILIDEE